MKNFISVAVLFLFIAGSCDAAVSEKTSDCLECHRTTTPGIVADWERSHHAQINPVDALKKPLPERRISTANFPRELGETVVGCAECHTMNSENHKDTFEHNGYQVHVIVSPENCAVCHPVEEMQYEQNIMANAYGNLKDNPLFSSLVKSVNGMQTFENLGTAYVEPDELTQAESCYFCHGTDVTVAGTTTRETDFGEMEFPVLTGWPNQGVGRLNPDGSKGACTPCHARHEFSIEMARKPYTCSECHKGPDVPAYKVYSVSKHGNMFSSMSADWDFENVPWVVGKDFTAPTCATCHVSMLTTDEGETIVERSHQMNDRLSWRIFGLPYAHPHPKSPNTALIKNKAGLPLPTELTGEPVMEYVISAEEQNRRRETMQQICLACHSASWVENQYIRLENTIATTNEMTLTATQILTTAWEKGAAKGLPQGEDIFDEALEKKWVEHWLFFANSTRFASAMAGADYGAFANGRWYLAKNIQEMADWLEFKLQSMEEE